MHDRNIFKLRPPNYEELARKYEDFRVKCFIGAGGKVCVDFSDAEAVRLLTQILLMEYFELDVHLPVGYLVPRVPQRLNYILLLEDLICKNTIRTLNDIWGIDIGTGASCIFPLLGARLNKWNFVATEVDVNSISFATQNIDRNNLGGQICIIHSTQKSLLKEMISGEAHRDKLFAFSMCNPPFFDPDEASQKFTSVSAGNTMGNLLTNITDPTNKTPPRSATTATPSELIYSGGETSFIKKMINESADISQKIYFFTTMVGKMSNLKLLKEELNKRKIRWAVHSLCQGKTTRWVLVWTFYDDLKIE